MRLLTLYKDVIFSVYGGTERTLKLIGSSVGRVVKLLACGARGPGFDSPPRHLNFRDWLSPASKSRYS